MDASDYQITEPLMQALARCARGERSDLLSCLECSEQNVEVGTTHTLAHSYFLKTNGNGQLVINELATFLVEQIIDYALPREKIQEAQRQFERDGTSSLFSRIHNEARRLFVSSENSGEAGELLLFSFAERVFDFPQLLSKMSLKTSSEMHYHGADGVFAQGRSDGGLNLYWGEAKIRSHFIRPAPSCLPPSTHVRPQKKQTTGHAWLRQTVTIVSQQTPQFTPTLTLDTSANKIHNHRQQRAVTRGVPRVFIGIL